VLIPQRGVRKENNQQRHGRHHGVDQTSQALPAGTLWVVKDGLSHAKLIVHRMPHAAHGQFQLDRRYILIRHDAFV